jgi:hypothetical protein
MQVRAAAHTSRSTKVREAFENEGRFLKEVRKRFFKLFEESTLEGRLAVARSMNKIAKRQPKPVREYLLLHSLYFLLHFSNSEMLSWPNSPVLVMLQLVDPNVLFGQVDGTRFSLLHHLAKMADPSDYSTHENQLILAKQLIERGTNFNAGSVPNGVTPLHDTCFSGNVTNLDYIEYLLEAGADPNAQTKSGTTPLMCTVPNAPGAAKFLMNWPTTDANITTRSGASFLTKVRYTITHFSDRIALPDNPNRVHHQFVLQQWRDIEEMLVESSA